MPSAHRQNGFDFRFYSNDHLPMHVHAIKGGEICVFFLGNVEERVDDNGNPVVVVLEAPSLRENESMKPANFRRALAIVQENQHKMILKWKEHLG